MKWLRLLPVLLLCACSETKYVTDGNYLLDHNYIHTDGKYAGINTGNLKNYLRQRPNSRWFSLVKLPLATYSLSGRDSTKWVNRTLRSIGEAPVIFDSVKAQQTCKDLQLALQNQGYLRTKVDFDVYKRKKRVDAIYTLHPGNQYHIRQFDYQIQDTTIARLLRFDDKSQWLLKEGERFDVNVLDAERKRITQHLNDLGYFRFHKEYITYLVDSVENSYGVDVTLVLSCVRRDEKTDTLHQRYKIGKINYLSGDRDHQNLHLRNKVLRESTYLGEGEYYSGSALQNTYNHFGRLQAVKYTNISFTEHPDSALLDCDIQLSTNKPSTISFQPEGTNTAGDLGAAASLTYQNRNLFRGSESLSVELRGAYEAIRGLEGYSNQDFMEYSLETRLSFPRFIMPFVSNRFRRSINASSELSLLYDVQNRPEFHRRVVSASWRYKWYPQNQRHHYQWDLLDLNYVFMPWISSTFRTTYLENKTNSNVILSYNYADLFIMKTGFGYSYNNGRIALKTNVETAGNLLNFGARLMKTEQDGKGQYRLFNIAFAQYVKGDFDITRSIRIDEANTLVFHAGLGLAYPYGNSRVLPFEKRYFSGGANSVRGWSVRSLGPGKYKERDGRINFISQTGDMKLDLNMEYRTHLFWKLDGAIFVDAGNIWTLRDYPEQSGGQFRFQDFYKQIAVSYGFGFRFNFDYFILRFDLGMKAINPAYEEDDEEHYPLWHPNFSRDFAFHFAVGLPF